MVRHPNIASASAEARALSSSFTSFPIDPFKIAEDHDISVVSGDPGQPGISGCIVFSNEAASIYYSRAISTAGFQRFTVAHELGHYFIPGHPEEILASGGTHLSKGDFEGTNPIEREADQFAAHLLMPTKLSRELLLTAPRGLEGITALAEAAIASITSAAIRAIQIDPYPMAIIKSKNDGIQFSMLTPKMKAFGYMRPYSKGQSLPEVHEPSESHLADWFDTAPSGLKVRGETIFLGAYGKLTVITPISAVIDPYEDEDEDEDAALEASWKLRFGGQR